MFYFREICCTAVYYFNLYNVLYFSDVVILGLTQWRYFSAIDFIYRRGVVKIENYYSHVTNYAHIFTRPRLLAANEYDDDFYYNFERFNSIDYHDLLKTIKLPCKKINICGMTLILPPAHSFDEEQHRYKYLYYFDFIDFDHAIVPKYTPNNYIDHDDEIALCAPEIFLPLKIDFDFDRGIISEIKMVRPIYKNEPGKEIILKYSNSKKLRRIEIKWRQNNKIVEFHARMFDGDFILCITYFESISRSNALAKACEILQPIMKYFKN